MAVEDKFVVVGIKDAPKLCPSYESGQVINLALRQAKNIMGSTTPVFDLRGLDGFYDDVKDFIDGFEQESDVHVLVGKKDEDKVEELGLRRRGFKVLTVRGHSLPSECLDVTSFFGSKSEDGSFRETLEGIGDLMLSAVVNANTQSTGLWRMPKSKANNQSQDDDAALKELFEPRHHPLQSYLEIIPKHKLSTDELKKVLNVDFVSKILKSHLGEQGASNTPINQIATALQDYLPAISQLFLLRSRGLVEDLDQYARAAYLLAFLKKLHRHSLLIEFAMASKGDDVVCVPYHSQALHKIDFGNRQDLIIGRPGVIANATASFLSSELVEFQRLLNSNSTRERHIQTFLEKHPTFLRGLNYRNVYPQLVLQRDDNTKLVPDFILEPFDGAWCDILDVKLPRQKLIVGRKDRAALAAGIHEVAAQLREYAAYFEQDKYRKFVMQKYGLKVYRPRLIALVGRDLWQMTSEEVRRAMTSYEGLEIVTFDALLEHSKNRILI